jgi:hypothetical protein
MRFVEQGTPDAGGPYGQIFSVRNVYAAAQHYEQLVALFQVQLEGPA